MLKVELKWAELKWVTEDHLCRQVNLLEKQKQIQSKTNTNNATRYLHARLKNYTFLSVSSFAGGEDNVYSEPWLEMTEDMLLAVVDIGQQERLP